MEETSRVDTGRNGYQRWLQDLMDMEGGTGWKGRQRWIQDRKDIKGVVTGLKGHHEWIQDGRDIKGVQYTGWKEHQGLNIY